MAIEDDAVSAAERQDAGDMSHRDRLLVCGSVGLIVWLPFAILGQPARGQIAAIASALLALVVTLNWQFRKKAWFVSITVLIAIAQFAVICAILWPQRSYPGGALAPEAFVYFVVVAGLVKGAERIFEK